MAETKTSKVNSKPSSAAVKPAVSKKTPSPAQLEKEIRATAQALYEERCEKGRPGDANTDWATAETKVKAKYQI